jgi:ribosomal protein S12 methylthiotransferase accessory factor
MFRSDILNLHSLTDSSLSILLERLSINEVDEYSYVSTLIGVAFDENTVWGQLTVIELKLLIHLALGQLEESRELVGALLQYNDNTVDRGLFFQALESVLEVRLGEELDLDDYVNNFRRMFGHNHMTAAIGSIEGSVRFFGLTVTNMNLEGLDRHQRLMNSYEKLHKARSKSVS